AAGALAALVQSSMPETLQGAGASAGPVESTDTALDESGKLLDAAVAAYLRGDERATALAADAYFQFEPLEPRLGATAPGLKTRIEERFLHLRQALHAPDRGAEIQALATAIHTDFSAARTALQPHTSRY